MPDVPLCFIVRRGPSHYSRLIKWNTLTDELELGSWIRGTVDPPTFTPDGKYMAFGIMGGWQLAVVIKPPFFHPLAKEVGGLCFTRLVFDELGHLSGSAEHVGTDGKAIPISKSTFGWGTPTYYSKSRQVFSSKDSVESTDQQGRRIVFAAGCIYVDHEGEDVLLLDTNGMEKEWIEIPDWAKEW